MGDSLEKRLTLAAIELRQQSRSAHDWSSEKAALIEEAIGELEILRKVEAAGGVDLRVFVERDKVIEAARALAVALMLEAAGVDGVGADEWIKILEGSDPEWARIAGISEGGRGVGSWISATVLLIQLARVVWQLSKVETCAHRIVFGSPSRCAQCGKLL